MAGKSLFPNRRGGAYFSLMNVDAITLEALRLPLEDRAKLAASLWESIEDPFELASGRSDDEAFDLALSRDAELESRTAPLFHRELLGRLRKIFPSQE